jgi:hypothetical protein
VSAGNGALSSLSTEEMRAAVRAVLREVLPTVLPAVLDDARDGAAGAQPAGQPAERVALADDRDLDAFVRRLAALCEDPAQRAALRDGRRRFVLGGGPATPRGYQAPPPPAGGSVRVERGAVTERTVARAAADGCRLVLGRRAVLTPLARDKARVLGVEIEKER